MMSAPITRVGVTPCHPGELIREEILAELGLRVARTAEVPAVLPATGHPPGLARQPHVRQRAGESDVKRYEPA